MHVALVNPFDTAYVSDSRHTVKGAMLLPWGVRSLWW